ncbi:MAG: HAMP domain-containing histidine kinase [Corynebacteriales bacterium]|nr:HAMP domain-containing histidine kinase [Mycobacteriales bacterium]
MSSNPPTEHRGLANWSLRARLLVVVVALMTVACLVIGVVTELALRKYLLGQLDDRLTSAVDRSVAGADLPPPPDGDRGPRFLFAPGQGENTLGADIDIDGNIKAGVINSKGDFEDVSASAQQTLKDLPTDRKPHTRDLGEVGEYRLIAAETAGGRTIITGLPMQPMQDTLAQLGLIMAGVSVMGLAVLGVAGAWIIRITLWPLRRVVVAARRVSELPLHEGEVAVPIRVPEADANPRTEVGQVGAALNRMIDHVDNALRARQASETRVRQFVADASHELRTPLAAIRGYAELARHSQEPTDIVHSLNRVEMASARMTTLVEELLLLARLDAAKNPVREPVDLTRLVVDAASDARVAGPDHRWQLDVGSDPVVVQGDSTQLHQVVANLLSNARTHTPPSTTVIVGVRQTHNRSAVLTVADDGPGIPANLQSEIFERFARGDTSRSRSAGGSGLGLAIVAAIVAAHHGDVTVNSEPGRTIFTVTLPV